MKLIKGVLWGWCGDVNAQFGGAKYCSNGVPDVGTETIIAMCPDNSTDFSKGLENGELLWMQGHVGIVVDAKKGLCVECSPKWKNKVQYSNIANIGFTKGNSRYWKKHGHLPWVEYVKDEVEDMTKEELKAFIEDVVKNMGRGQEASDWAKESVEKAVEMGITDGSNPQAWATRQEVMLMAKRGAEYEEK